MHGSVLRYRFLTHGGGITRQHRATADWETPPPSSPAQAALTALLLNHLSQIIKWNRSNLLVEGKVCGFQTFGRTICKTFTH
jgi:hypothetical protein